MAQGINSPVRLLYLCVDGPECVSASGMYTSGQDRETDEEWTRLLTVLFLCRMFISVERELTSCRMTCISLRILSISCLMACISVWSETMSVRTKSKMARISVITRFKSMMEDESRLLNREPGVPSGGEIWGIGQGTLKGRRRGYDSTQGACQVLEDVE